MMASESHPGHKGTSLSRLLGAGVGISFLLYNLWSFREHYLLKHESASVQGTVTRTGMMRRKGGIAYSVDYGFDTGGKHFEGSGQINAATYLKLRPGGPIAISYASSDPTISETSEMSHNNVSLFLIGFLGIPASLIMLGVNIRGERLPKQYAHFAVPEHTLELDPAIGDTAVEMPNGITGIAYTMYPVTNMARARRFYEELLGLRPARDIRGEWVEYHLWDSCFALTTFGGDGLKPSSVSGGRVAFEVNNVDAFVNDLRKKGIQIKLEPFTTPICRMAVVIDTEGNALTLHARKA